MASNNYRDPIIQKVIDTLQPVVSSELRDKQRWYNGDVLIVPKRELPVVSIAKDATNIMPTSTTEDEHIMPMVLNVLWDYTRDLTKSSDIVAGVNSLYKVMEGRGDDDGNPYNLNTDSIAYQLRKNVKLATNMWLALGQGETVSIDYGLGIERRGPGIFSVEAVARFTVRLHQAKAT